MKRVVVVLALGLFAAACGHSDLQKPATQDDFGVQMAKMNLWREAMFRFKRAVQINPNDALAHNNLAVAYEAVGDFDNARKEYLEALRLDRTNAYIQKNYSRYVEFLSRNRKRSPKETPKTATTSMPTPGGSATTVDNPGTVPHGTAAAGSTAPRPTGTGAVPSDLPPATPPGPPTAAPQPPTPTPPTPPPPGGSR